MLEDCWSLEIADEDRCREIVERREVGAIESAGVGRGELMVARVRFTVKGPRMDCLIKDRDEEARKLIRGDWRERDSMEGKKRGIIMYRLM
jgi:hypothetical protein